MAGGISTDTPAAITSPAALRWSLALALPALCIGLAVLLAHGPSSPGHPPVLSTALEGGGSISLVQTLCLLMIALAACAWGAYPSAGSFMISSIVFACLVWAWAARQVLGIDIVACGFLIGAAVRQRRARVLQWQRMRQVLEDLGEESRVVDQGIEVAGHTQEALQKKLARYTHLQTIAEALSSLTDPASIAQLVVDRTFDLIGKSDVCLLFLVNEERQELSLVASKKRDAIAAIRAKRGDQFDRYVLRTHCPLLVNDARRDFRFAPPFRSSAHQRGGEGQGLPEDVSSRSRPSDRRTGTAAPERDIGSVVACPLLLDQSPAGVLRLDSVQPTVYTQDDLRFLDILLDLVATAVTNAKLFARAQQLAMTDGLTGLMLRRPFLEQFARELNRSSRSREPVSVLLVDVDHFKAYNDTFGHIAGDVVLKRIAEALSGMAPPGAVVARYGGEEFIVLLPRMSRAQAHDVAEQIRRAIAEPRSGASRSAPGASVRADWSRSPGRSAVMTRTSKPEPMSPATVSIGVSTAPDDAQAELELIRIADQRLYRAKREGRNRVHSGNARPQSTVHGPQ